MQGEPEARAEGLSHAQVFFFDDSISLPRRPVFRCSDSPNRGANRPRRPGSLISRIAPTIHISIGRPSGCSLCQCDRPISAALERITCQEQPRPVLPRATRAKPSISSDSPMCSPSPFSLPSGQTAVGVSRRKSMLKGRRSCSQRGSACRLETRKHAPHAVCSGPVRLGFGLVIAKERYPAEPGILEYARWKRSAASSRAQPSSRHTRTASTTQSGAGHGRRGSPRSASV